MTKFQEHFLNTNSWRTIQTKLQHSKITENGVKEEITEIMCDLVFKDKDKKTTP